MFQRVGSFFFNLIQKSGFFDPQQNKIGASTNYFRHWHTGVGRCGFKPFKYLSMKIDVCTLHMCIICPCWYFVKTRVQMKINDSLKPNGRCYMCGTPVKPDELFCTMQCFLAWQRRKLNKGEK